ncbi:hypothetical protein [Mycolicibacterium bacteremicum]|uniref:LysM domain-containing protein n=1 Tax=Mycolicibacterium bacteremicum TaxID=564198 RepID=A0A1W9Z4G6_MYCBA|nr:hypothetical protein [Mycolicibacterium bacteremicum]MCV7433712.1 LysM domain-containing protein [Mycolicibacterium bacteremicum]ORA07248.1 hypothetical protein BST17_01940 [Mycolicibacterium bacteremicum]
MFDPTSRYAGLAVAVFVDSQGRERAYVSAREVPPAVTPRAEDVVHVVGGDERQDRITWQYLGDPTLYWQLADANGALHPDELTATVGRQLLIPVDGRQGRR